PGFPRVALHLFLISLRRFIQFSSYIPIVRSGDRQPLALAGMVAQLERPGVVLHGPSHLAERVKIAAYYSVAQGKIRVELDSTLMVCQACARSFLIRGLVAKAERL